MTILAANKFNDDINDLIAEMLTHIIFLRYPLSVAVSERIYPCSFFLATKALKSQNKIESGGRYNYSNINQLDFLVTGVDISVGQHM